MPALRSRCQITSPRQLHAIYKQVHLLVVTERLNSEQYSPTARASASVSRYTALALASVSASSALVTSLEAREESDQSPLCSHRETLTQRFFTRHALDEKSCLHYPLPPKRDEKNAARLRKRRYLKPAELRPIGFITLLYPTLSEIFCSSF